ncbi:hypothetical protein BJV85_001861 [Clostridium acetobutylicum]|uniref:SRPBCC family protein n=1 Tax=Clostridium acetobutylicum (strain ATCC 824 / DSM 792 / JCM 1419 / IAM 19013 / LMG 5710 / NBRC 13948 / NRRL B-527 / VKM B-1787 / 2291 / W) TaxID=272562 RepID=Q97HJ6_CLOAB|nr:MULTISPECIES: hypothetical protein [Clostridium]AAK79974.1 Hypothetical protein CA_C2015 [Clostridium acetobutylicum ATCC 824]ADZ21067.1 Conserved hypothetical protein [Clostridium acetobutylicum EA 2018]AEI32129.1 hypothetical protein SMB_G2047 [Clostridium acetobutylicum DSM 1731]AWV79595.1 hypothetical protein DK921_05665 [Clostridium acetobutylicum]MBC2394432.1 hypothetical protein [Clostridium acetobutylicum]
MDTVDYKSHKNVEISNVEFDVTELIKTEEGSPEVIFDYIYDLTKFTKWFSFFPFIWGSSKSKYWDVGNEVKFKCSIPPFSYILRCVEVVPNKYILSEIHGFLKGSFKIELIPTEDGILLDKKLIVSGKTPIGNSYYMTGAKRMHKPYVKWRLKILKRILRGNIINKREYIDYGA